MKKYISSSLMLAVLMTVVFGIVFKFRPDLCFEVYTGQVFSLIRKLFNGMNLWLVFFFWFLIVFSWFRHVYRLNPPDGIMALVVRNTKPLIWIIVFFYWFWGFNYMAVKPEDIIGIGKDSISHDDYLYQLQNQVILVNQLRSTLSDKDIKIIVDRDPALQSPQWHQAVTAFLNPLGYNTNGKPKILLSKPEGILLRFGTAGFFNFPIARPIVEGALHPLQIPITTLHELAHTYGVADEASANFVAYLASKNIEDVSVQYACELSFLRNLGRQAQYIDPDQSKVILQGMDSLVRRDIRDIRKQMSLYPDLAPDLRDFFYDGFLKSQGVQAGIGSYDLYVDLVLKWRQKNKNSLQSY